MDETTRSGISNGSRNIWAFSVIGIFMEGRPSDHNLDFSDLKRLGNENLENKWQEPLTKDPEHWHGGCST